MWLKPEFCLIQRMNQTGKNRLEIPNHGGAIGYPGSSHSGAEENLAPAVS
jgi:hypothetical protein